MNTKKIPSIGGVGLMAGALACAAFTLAARQVSGATLLFDRGLPTANLNNAAGSDRSNVAWADTETSTNPTNYWLPGDNFTLSSNAQVSDIRVWIVGAGTTAPGNLPTGLSLLGGDSGGAISTISTSYTDSSVTYSNGETYQGSSGSYWNIYQVDFNVSLNLAANQTYDFFVDQPYVSIGSSSYANAFLHASNATLSGSAQQGADGATLWLPVNSGVNGSVETWNSGGIGGTGTTGWAAGWDKNSDANVQVFGTITPIPGSGFLAAVGGLALIGGMALRRRMAKLQ